MLTAVAAQGAENVPGEALGVDAQEGRCGVNIAHDQGDGFLPALGLALAESSLEPEDPKNPPARREFGRGNLFD